MQDSEPADSESWGIPDFEWFSMNSGQNSQNFGEIYRIPVRLTEHLLQDFQCRPWGVCVDIFWKIAKYRKPVRNMLNGCSLYNTFML